jgi:hypothetical protein
MLYRRKMYYGPPNAPRKMAIRPPTALRGPILPPEAQFQLGPLVISILNFRFIWLCDFDLDCCSSFLIQALVLRKTQFPRSCANGQATSPSVEFVLISFLPAANTSIYHHLIYSEFDTLTQHWKRVPNTGAGPACMVPPFRPESACSAGPAILELSLPSCFMERIRSKKYAKSSEIRGRTS